MMRQSSQRGQKAKGLNLKLILQICLLVGAGIWLLFQLKHSYEERQDLIPRDGTVSSKSDERREATLRLGRKGLPLEEEVSDRTDARRIPEEDNEQEEKQKALEVATDGDNIFGDNIEDQEEVPVEEGMTLDEALDALEEEEQNLDDAGDGAVEEAQINYDHNSDDHFTTREREGRSEEGAEATNSRVDLSTLPSDDHREDNDIVDVAAE